MPNVLEFSGDPRLLTDPEAFVKLLKRCTLSDA